MNNAEFVNIIKKITLCSVLVFALNSNSYAAYYPLEIIQPQPNLDIENRFYKAYPGLEYNVRLAVAGGLYPFRFSLIDAPDGMEIDHRGEISWPSPVLSGSPYSVTASVTDSEHNSKNVSWTIRVTTEGFLFVDAVNGKTSSNGGTGTKSNPWKTMKDLYGGNDDSSKWSIHHPGAFVYWREGEYMLDAYLEDCHLQEGCRVPWSGRKPIVWIAYPGEKPEINFNSSRFGYIFFRNSIENLYLDGFDFNLNGNYRGKGIAIEAGGNTTVRKSTFRGLTDCTHPGTNNSQLFFTAGSMGKFTSIQDNTASDSCGYWLLGYDSPKTVVESNRITTDIPLPISPKSGNQYWTIRGNHIEGYTTRGAIYLQEFGHIKDIEISFNHIKLSGDDSVAITLRSSNPGGSVAVYRNTIVGHLKIWDLNNNAGPWAIERNVIINNQNENDKIRRVGSVDETRIINRENVVGSLSDNIIDSRGYFTPSYNEYIGKRGHILGDQPMSPPIIDVQ